MRPNRIIVGEVRQAESLDLLLALNSGLPGSAMGDRAALLIRDTSARQATRKSCLDFYGIRSSIVHGGRSSKLMDDALSTGFALAHATAWRLLDLEEVFAPTSDDHVDELFDNLRLGVLTWPVTTD